MFHARLPAGIMPQQLDFQELFQHDLQCVEKKMQMKEQADGKKGMKTWEVQVGGCNTCEKRIQHQSHSAFWERAVRGAASKGNTSGHQNERWLHHYTVNGRFYDGTLPDFRGGRKMEVKAMCQARRTA